MSSVNASKVSLSVLLAHKRRHDLINSRWARTGSLNETLRSSVPPPPAQLDPAALDKIAADSQGIHSSVSALSALLDEHLARSTELAPKDSTSILVAELLAALSPVLSHSKLDSAAVLAAVEEGLCKALPPAGPVAIDRDSLRQELASVLPAYFDAVKPVSLDQERLSDLVTTSVIERLPRWDQTVVEALRPMIEASAPPLLNVDSLVSKLLSSLPSPSPRVDVGPVNLKLDDLSDRMRVVLSSQLQFGSRLDDLAILRAEIDTATARLRDSQSSHAVVEEKLRATEEERARLAEELAALRKASLEALAFRAKVDLQEVKHQSVVQDLRSKVATAETERDASLEREALFKKENETRAIVRPMSLISHLYLRASADRQPCLPCKEFQRVKVQLELSKRSLNMMTRTWQDFQTTTSKQLGDLVASDVDAKKRAVDERHDALEENRRLENENQALQRKVRPFTWPSVRLSSVF